MTHSKLLFVIATNLSVISGQCVLFSVYNWAVYTGLCAVGLYMQSAAYTVKER